MVTLLKEESIGLVPERNRKENKRKGGLTMNKRLRAGKSSELIVTGQLTRHGVDVYTPCVDDQAIDLVVRVERPDGVRFYDVQVKSVKNYNRVIGLKPLGNQQGRYVLIIHYRNDKKPDEFLYLTRKQIALYHPKHSVWGDLVLKKKDRAQYAHQTLSHLAHALLNGEV